MTAVKLVQTVETMIVTWHEGIGGPSIKNRHIFIEYGSACSRCQLWLITHNNGFIV